MADPLQNAAFLQQLFRPVSDVGAGFGEAGVKAATLGYQDRLRQLKAEQDQQDAERDFRYRTALTNLTIAGQERIAQSQTERTLKSQELQTNRAIEQQNLMTQRAMDLATAKELADARKQYRLLAGKDAKELASFGDTPQAQLDGINQELALLNDAKAKSAANIYLRTQKALDEEMQRITTITDKDEATLVANALGSITDKGAREKLAKFKGATNSASILTFLAPLYPGAAAEFSAGYEAAKDAVINNRAKGSKVQSLQRDLQYKAPLLKDPSVLNYISLGLVDESAEPAVKAAKVVTPLDNLFGGKAVIPAIIPPRPQSQPVAAPQSTLAPALPFSGAPNTSLFVSPTSNARRNDAVRDSLVAATQGIGNFISPSNWTSDYQPGSRVPIPDALYLNTPDETVVAQLLSRLSGMADSTSPRSAGLRNQLYDLTSPAAYINSRR